MSRKPTKRIAKKHVLHIYSTKAFRVYNHPSIKSHSKCYISTTLAKAKVFKSVRKVIKNGHKFYQLANGKYILSTKHVHSIYYLKVTKIKKVKVTKQGVI